MRKIVVILLFVVMAASSLDQVESYLDYLHNYFRVFNSINEKTGYYMRELKVKKLEEFRINVDSNGAKSEPKIVNRLLFDTAALLTNPFSFHTPCLRFVRK